MGISYVYWVTGLPGSGKTTIGVALAERLTDQGRRVIQLDGDRLRDVLGGQYGYSFEERLHLAMCYARLCKLLSEQDADVVCATVSMFESVRRWNRENIAGYREIYLTAPQAQLLERRAFYRDDTEAHEVVGRNPAYELPTRPDARIHNDGQQSPAQIAEQILSTLSLFRQRVPRSSLGASPAD